MNTRSLATAITSLAAAMLTACGSADTTTAQVHDQADITFVQQMIPHHAQAVEMSKLAADRSGSAQVKELAGRIQSAQQPEIDQMNGLLRAWNATTPTPSEAPMSGMDHSDTDHRGMGSTPGMESAPGMGSMPGMMTSAQMTALQQSRGAAFDQMFLRMMIGHHQGAVDMSGVELRDGRNSDAKALAGKIIDAQRREITEMQGLGPR